MPQLEFSTYASQIFWLAIIFTILYVYLSKKSLPVIMEVLCNRQSRISDDLKKAESLKSEAEAAEVDFTAAIVDARQKASKTMSDAKAKIAAEEAIRIAKIEKNFANQSKEAEHRLVILRKEAIDNLLPVAAQAAILMAEKIVGSKVDSKHAEAVVFEISNKVLTK